jgi:HK97 family phage major capsid protein
MELQMSIKALRERRDALAKQLQDLVDKDKTPEWQAEHQEKYDAAMKEIADIDAQIKRHTDAMAAIAAGAASGDGDPDGLRNRFTRTPGAHNAPEETRAMRDYLRNGLTGMQPEDLGRMRARQTPDIRATMSTTTGTEGGYTVATEYYQQLTQALKAYGGVRAAAYEFQSGTGADMNFPAADATSEVGELVGQNAAVSAADTAFSNLVLSVYKFSSKKIAVPFELLQDSMFDLEAYINALLAMRIGRSTAGYFATGTGTSQPRGLVTAAASGKVGATGQTTTVLYDDLVDLQHSVDPAYRASPGVGFMMNDDSVRIIRKIKDDQGRPIFVPGYEQGVPGGAPDMLLGKPIYICQEMATMAANAKSILFGDFRKYFIRNVMDLTLFRMADSGFLLNGQIGFVAFNRQGGNLIDVGGAVKYYQNSAT